PAGSVDRLKFGKTDDGKQVDLYTLKNNNGMVVKIMTYGATVTEVDVPDRNGKIENVTLGFGNFQAYEHGSPYFGATVGRYANRIAKGMFTLNGQQYNLAVNNGVNSLHGGKIGLDKGGW